ncbi:MAG TPA: AtpZ/AtpI family protein [Caulobacteraceae bacterium]|nr:AtpZ/AtpI family protein [Caulobacteraceae bacterium]
MPDNDPVRSDGGKHLEDRLKAFEQKRDRSASSEQGQALAAGYRFLASMIGGVLTGVGLGWLLDRFAGTAPWGIIGGLLIGSTVSIISVVRTAGRMSNRATKAGPPPAAAGFDDEDED